MKTLIVADQLIDGTGAKPVERGAVLVENGRIVAVGRQADLGVPEGAKVVAAAPGTTMMPGLIDTHVHLAYSGLPHKKAFRAELVEMSYPAIALRSAKYALDTLKAGFTSVRDMHAPGGVIIDLAHAIEKGEVPGPRIMACGRGLSVTGGHMDQPGWADHTEFRDLVHPCDGPEGFRLGARREIKRGADFIKINTCISFVGKEPGVWWRQEMTDDEIRAAVDEAHSFEMHVAAHTTGGPGLLSTIVNGVDTVEHAHFTDERIIEAMVKHGTFYVPTLLVNDRNFEFTPEEQGVSPRSWKWLNASREAKWKTLAAARAAGVKICAGTDTGYMLTHGEMNWREMHLLVKGGLSPMEAIVAATGTNADLMGWDVGRLKPGLHADVLLVAGDPLADITILGQRERLRVFKGGAEVV